MQGWTWNGVRILIIKKPSLFFICPMWCGLIRINVDAGMNLKRLEIERKEGGATGRDERQREKKRKKWEVVKRWWEAEKRKGVAAAECYFRFMIEKTSYLYLFFFKCWHGWTGSVRFNLFQTLKTETKPNQNFFVIF